MRAFHPLLDLLPDVFKESLAKQCFDGGMSYAERAAKREALKMLLLSKQFRDVGPV